MGTFCSNYCVFPLFALFGKSGNLAVKKWPFSMNDDWNKFSKVAIYHLMHNFLSSTYLKKGKHQPTTHAHTSTMPTCTTKRTTTQHTPQEGRTGDK
jgi:hypothetical protein